MTNNGDAWAANGAPDARRRCSKNAATNVQKVYRSYRTRRRLADSAVVAEEHWWQAIDFARLNHRTISFFNFMNPESVVSRWNRVSLNASKVGKGLSRDEKAQKLAFEQWIEAIDARHRYGHNLHLYYREWCKTYAGQPFFYWLDVGDGKEVNIQDCPRSKLRQQCIKYLGPRQREHYEFVVVGGKILHKFTEKPLDTSNVSPGSKWIFVMCTSKKLYTAEKKKGLFHHSSFLAGGTTLATGRLTAENGVLKCISAYSGHYKPTHENLLTFLSFLKENGVDLDEIEIQKPNEYTESNDEVKFAAEDKSISQVSPKPTSLLYDFPNEEDEPLPSETTEPKVENEYKRTLSGGLKSPKTDVPKTSILLRINSKNAAKSYQLGHQLSAKWCTGAGPRIGCIADYPVELRLQALELTNLSPLTPED